MSRRKYSIEEKISVVKKVVDEKMGLTEAGREIGVHKADVLKWVSVYEQHGVAGLERHRICYTGEFKQSVVEDMRANGLSLRKTAAKYNIAIHNTVSRWERVYLEKGPEGLYEERRGRAIIANGVCTDRKSKLNTQVEEDLIAENQRLRAEVDYLKKLKALVLEREHKKRNPR